MPASTLYWVCFKIYEKNVLHQQFSFSPQFFCFFFTFLLFFQQACSPPLIFKISCTFYFNYFLVKIIIIVYSLYIFVLLSKTNTENKPICQIKNSRYNEFIFLFSRSFFVAIFKTAFFTFESLHLDLESGELSNPYIQYYMFNSDGSPYYIETSPMNWFL